MPTSMLIITIEYVGFVKVLLQLASTGSSHICVNNYTDMDVITAGVGSSLRMIIIKGPLNEEGHRCH